MDPYITLGIPSTSSEQDIKKTYRKLRGQYHPDRAGGNRAKFEEVQAAYNLLERYGFRWVPPRKSTAFEEGAFTRGFTQGFAQKDNINDIFREFEDVVRKTRTQEGGDVIATVFPHDMFYGHSEITTGIVNKSRHAVQKGLPHGHRMQYGNFKVTLKFVMPDGYRIRGLQDEGLSHAGRNIGDIEMDIELNAIDLITGSWITVKSILNEELSVRVPEGFDPKSRLKIAEKGYYAWLKEFNRPSERRADMYVRIKPVFTPPHKIDPEKIETLYKMVR